MASQLDFSKNLLLVILAIYILIIKEIQKYIAL
jgi:hypothetical protein